MKLVERHIIMNNKELENLCNRSKLLYNQVLYYLRQSLFGKIQKFSEYDIGKLMAEFDDADYRSLPAQTSQQTIKLVFRNWKSYWNSKKEYKTNPSKFKTNPRLPKYKKKLFKVVFTNQQTKLRKGYIYFPKNTIFPLKTKVDNICQVRIIPQAVCYIVEVVYNKEEQDYELNNNNVLSIDLGLNNIVTGLTNVGLQPFLVNGKIIKSFNCWYNKKRAFLQSKLEKKKYNSKKIEYLTLYRNCWIEDKLHKISDYIIQYCKDNDIGTIVIGKNLQWKQNINIGKRNNQNFVNIPHARLMQKIVYKGKLIGINVKEQEEGYTSKCDHLALEVIEYHKVYLGKRVKRGLFKSSVGKLINSDVNGALGIGLKAKVFRKSFIKSLLDSGLVLNPIKINIF